MKHISRTAAFLFMATFNSVLAAGAPEPDSVQLVVGNEVWQSGHQYRSGSEWLAFVCNGAGCAFEPALLVVRAKSWQGQYDDKPTPGQNLTFRKVNQSGGKVLAWFHMDAKHAWLTPGPVLTYASSAAPLKRPPTDGTLEVAIDLPDGSQARLVPLLDKKDERIFRLQLRSQGKRQLLGELGNCSHAVSMDYFLWSGDLDTDGRPDYLINYVDAGGQVILYLSSSAKADEPVGPASTYDTPSDYECGGDGD